MSVCLDWLATRARFWFVLMVSLGVVVALHGCGRSSLDDVIVFDGGTPDGNGPDAPMMGDGGACNPSTCPGGCCDPSGVCRAGSDLQACGTFGITCNDCQAQGFDFCDVQTQACGKTVNGCDPTTCAGGCCNGNECLSGSDPDQCGTGGQACQQCATNGLACDPASRTCSGIQCGAANCAGCCVGDICVSGSDGTACGRSGAQCDNCTAQGQTCQASFPGGLCVGMPSCGPGNCDGCCAGDVCVTGGDDTSCGLKGQQCTNCTQFGEFCQPIGGTSGGVCSMQQCGPENCPGCCSGNMCIKGATDDQCGIKGQQCTKCGAAQQCQNGICEGNALCNPGNCSGCCIGDVCAVGSQATACGAGGNNCLNCASNGQVCTGNACVTTCGPGNCPGCCNGNSCVMGTTDSQCGSGGKACGVCTNGNTCNAASGTCQPPPPPCGPGTCSGCCDPTLGCVPGFLNSSCGSAGNTCANCQTTGSNCDTSVTPRSCKDAQTTCPAPYSTCPSNVTTAAPVIAHVCSALDLQNARAACGNATSIGCQSFFQFEQANNPSCAACLQPFDAAFNDLTGLAACVAPFVAATCNRSTGCAADCITTSCSQCAPGGFTQCRNDVQRNQCSSFLQQSTCIVGALSGAGSFCNPANYQGNFGQWLQGVGAHYCGP